MSTCRSCKEPIVWAKTTGGKSIPIDANDFGQPIPKATGNIRFTGRTRDGSPEVEIVTAAAGLFTTNDPIYLSHFATCPQSDSWRKPRGAA